MKKFLQQFLIFFIVVFVVLFGFVSFSSAATNDPVCECQYTINKETQTKTITGMSYTERECKNLGFNPKALEDLGLPTDATSMQCGFVQSKASGGTTKKKSVIEKASPVISASIDNQVQSLNMLGTDNPATVIGRMIKIALGIVGSISLLMFVAGGALWMTAAGNPERAKKGAQIVVWTSLGIVVILSSYALATFVLNAF